MKNTCPNLTKQIPAEHVMLLYWVKTKHDGRDCAGSGGSVIRPAKGSIKAAEELDRHGNRNLHDNHGNGVAPAGHGVTIL